MIDNNVFRTLAPLALITALGGAAVGCERRGEAPGGGTETTGAVQEPATVEKVKEAPSRFYGKRVTLVGEVDEVSGGQSFKLEGTDWIFDDEIRVLTKSPVKLGGRTLMDDDQVVVTGTVRQYVRTEVERELGWGPGTELDVEMRDKPVLVADEIRMVGTDAQWSAKQPEGQLVGTSILMTTPNPESLAGQKISLDRVTVQNVTGKGVWVGPSHADQTFILPGQGTDVSNLKPGQVVDVQGTVKKTPPAQEAVKSWNLPATMKNVVEGEPLYVEASQIAPAKAGAMKGKTQEPGGTMKGKTQQGTMKEPGSMQGGQQGTMKEPGSMQGGQQQGQPGQQGTMKGGQQGQPGQQGTMQGGQQGQRPGQGTTPRGQQGQPAGETGR